MRRFRSLEHYEGRYVDDKGPRLTRELHSKGGYIKRKLQLILTPLLNAFSTYSHVSSVAEEMKVTHTSLSIP